MSYYKNNTVKKWGLRIAVTGLLIAILLIVIVANPILLYAHQTVHNKHTIYHTTPLHPLLPSQLDEATALVKRSEFYNSNLALAICLNDGTNYTRLIKHLRGQAFAWGFHNKVVLQGSLHGDSNFVALHGYKWNWVQLLAHEMIHCYQFNQLGLWKSNPIANIPDWKWEGYAEYIARQYDSQKNLRINLQRLQQLKKESWAIVFEDSTIAPTAYYRAWLLVQYCMDIKQMSYQQLLADSTSEKAITNEMNNWYLQQ
jgi:hypothetical protein